MAFAVLILSGCGAGSGNSASDSGGGGASGGGSTGGGGNNGTPSPVLPAVVSVTPTGNAVSVNAPIEVTFNKAMKKATFITALDGLGLGVGYDPRCVDDSDCKTIWFFRGTNLEYNKSYTLTLLPQGRDQDGNLLSSAYKWTFKTAPFASPLSLVTIDGQNRAEPDAGECTAVAVDSMGTTHIVYYSESIGAPKHAFCLSGTDCTVSGNWTIEVIETPPQGRKFGRDINMAIDANDTLHVSYRDVDSFAGGIKGDGFGILKYVKAVKSGSTWTWAPPVIVDDTVNAVEDTYIAVSGNVVHISYRKTGDSPDQDTLAYATCAASCNQFANWSTVDIEQGNGAGAPNHIVVTGSAIHISYYLNGTLKYITCVIPNGCIDPKHWTSVVVDDGGGNQFIVGRENSLAVDGNVIHITYRDNTNRLLKYARCTSGSSCANAQNWKNAGIDAAGGSTQVTVAGGYIHVSYRDDLNKYLKYARCLSSSDCLDPKDWSIYTIDTLGEVGWDTYLGVESNGTIHISYRDFGNQDLKYASGVIP